MTRSDDKRLDDIRGACAAIGRLVSRGRAAFDQDEALWPALERLVEIAGEAATRLDPSTRAAYPDVDWRGLLGTRVLLAHAYHRVDAERLWRIATGDIPRLAVALGPSTTDG